MTNTAQQHIEAAEELIENPKLTPLAQAHALIAIAQLLQLSAPQQFMASANLDLPLP